MPLEQIKNNIGAVPIAREIFLRMRLVFVCLKKPHASRCFEYDKVITMQRFPTFEP
jgi:hypothetical protein